MDMNAENKTCQNCKRNFTIEPEDFLFYEKIKVPPPTFCPECRMQRRMAWRNERTLHRNKCGKSGQSVISCFSKDSPFTIYERDIWWGDDWNPLNFGQKYNFSKPFFTQFRNLLEKVPHPNLFIGKCVNTFYGNYIGEFRNAYLVSASWEGENVSYASRCNYCKDSMDMFATTHCQFCYGDVTTINCYETFFSQNADSCNSSYFLYDCRNCINCFGCTNLRNKSNCMWNEQLTKEEYDKKLKELNIGSHKNLQKAKEKFEILRLKALRRFANIINSVNVTGDNISHANNCYYCFDIAEDMKDCKYIMNSAAKFYTSYDGYGVGASTELLYEAMDSGVNGSRQLFDLTVWECLNAEYSINCHGCNNIFGCVGLRKSSYCIFNKQYSKDEYEKLRTQIIKQMQEIPYTDKKGRIYTYGEYFPAEISPFGYNETVAQDYFPLPKEDIFENGYNYVEREKPEHNITHRFQDLPDHIKDTNENILKAVIECESCKRVYKITESEFKFLKKFNLPIPRKCFECRHQERFKLVNFPRLYLRQCMCDKKHAHHSKQCHNEFKTTYSDNRPEIVYCEKCYQQEIY